MTETDQIANAESEIREALEAAGRPVSSAELSDRLHSTTPRSLIRLAVQRMIGRGTITYDADRHYSLGSVHQSQT
jgi:hypothetical protein